jgi:hypothetical protein
LIAITDFGGPIAHFGMAITHFGASRSRKNLTDSRGIPPRESRAPGQAPGEAALDGPAVTAPTEERWRRKDYP